MVWANIVEITEHILEPLPYHVELRDYLKSRERELWNWFASARAQADYTENLRLQLLKGTYRLDADAHPDLTAAVETVKKKLHLDIPVTVYQAQHNTETNAALYFIPGEGHVVFSGSILNLLNPDELQSLLGHELAHYWLWQWEKGELLIADRLLQSVVCDPRASDSHHETARRFQLYTEIFADRGSLLVTGDVHPVVSGLVKVSTGLGQVSAAGYLKQAEEIFAKEDAATRQHTHPESFIRARALSLWQSQRQGAEPQIARMIEGEESLDELDLIGQVRVQDRTRRLLAYLLRPKWFQTPSVMGHARMFFEDFRPAEVREDAVLESFRSCHPKMREYLCYLLLDFAVADPELEDLPLAAALHMSRCLEFDGQFEKLAAKELKMKVRDVRKLKDQAAEMLAKAEVGS